VNISGLRVQRMTTDESNQKELHDLAASMLKEKHSDQAIIGSLESRGLDFYYAEIVLENVKQDQEDKKQFWRHILSGGFVFVAGLALTIGTYHFAAPGSIFFIFSGIMLVGIASIIRGFILFRK
jgi:hypothetical protein